MTEQYTKPSINDPRIVRSVAANVDITDDNGFVVFDTTAGAITATLPDARTVPGAIFSLKATNAGTTGNAVTVQPDPATGQTIDGNATYDLTADQQGVLVQSDGDNFAVISNTAAGGGGSFGMFNPLVTPAIPDPDDVETWTDLPASWASWDPGGGALPQSRSVDRGALVLDYGSRPGGSGAACAGVYRPIPPETQWAAYTRISLIGPRVSTGGDFIECGFGVAGDLAAAPDTEWVESADVFRLSSNSSLTQARSISLTNYASSSSINSGQPSSVDFPGSFWFRIRKTTPANLTDYAADYSTDGIRWQTLHTGASFSVPVGGPTNVVIYGRSVTTAGGGTPDFRVVVGPVRFAVGPGSNEILSLMPAGTEL